jgi:hypothetical protein
MISPNCTEDGDRYAGSIERTLSTGNKRDVAGCHLLPFAGDTRGLRACLGRARPRLNLSGKTREIVTPLEALARKLAGEAPDRRGTALPPPSRLEIDHPVTSDLELTTILAMPIAEQPVTENSWRPGSRGST